MLQTGSKFRLFVLFLKSPEKFIRITNVYSSFPSGIVSNFSLRKLRKVPTNYRRTEISALWRCFSIFQRLDNSFEIYLKLFLGVQFVKEISTIPMFSNLSWYWVANIAATSIAYLSHIWCRKKILSSCSRLPFSSIPEWLIGWKTQKDQQFKKCDEIFTKLLRIVWLKSSIFHPDVSIQ